MNNKAIILQAGGFGLVAIDLAEVSSQAISRLPSGLALPDELQQPEPKTGVTE